MKTEDVEALAREACTEMCRVLSWPEHMAEQINRNSPLFLQIYTATAFEKAAQLCDVTPPHPFRPSIEAAHALHQMAEGLKP